VPPDRVDDLAGEYQPRPACDAVAARELVLRVSELHAGTRALQLAQEIFGLMFELDEIRTDGEMTIGHDGPPSTICPGSAQFGRKGGSLTNLLAGTLRWTQSFPRTGGALRAVCKDSLR